MSHVDVDLWTCDCCGRREELPSGGLPKGWHDVTGKPADGTDTGQEWELCSGCYHEMERLLAPKRDRVADLQAVSA